MKGKKEDKIIRELFRQKLENAEVIPGAPVRTDLMRRLGRREFLRFNPGRFNIYYMGGLLAAGIAAALLLTAGPDKIKSEFPPDQPVSLSKTVMPDSLSGSESQIAYQISENRSDKGLSGPVKTKLSKSRDGNFGAVPGQNTAVQYSNGVTRSEVNTLLSRKGLLSEPSPGRNYLQGNSRSKGALFESSVTSGCTPLKVHFQFNASIFDSCYWTFGDGGYSFEKEPEWIYDIEGEYNVGLNVFTKEDSREISSSVITVYPKPLARFEFSPENPVIPDDEIRFINYSTGAVKFRWEFGDGNTSDLFEPRYRYKKFGNYNIRLVVSSEFGCSDSLVVHNAYAGSGYFIDFPNAFIPNSGGPTGGYYSPKSDESAQIFHPEMSGVSDFQLRIFSKRGILIFESRDVNIGWDGYYNGQASEPGVYIWKVRGNFLNGVPFIKMGDLTLLKNGQ